MEQLELCKNIINGVVEGGGRHQNDLFPPADIEYIGIGPGRFVAKPMGFVNDHIIETVQSEPDDLVKFSQGLHPGRDTKIVQTLLPVAFQDWRTDHQNSPLELLQHLGGYKGFTEANHIGQKDSIVLIQFF